MKSYPKVAILALIILAFASDEMQKSTAQTICNVPTDGLMACRPAVILPNPAQPSPACCSALAHADVKCLCSYRHSSYLPSLGIDPDLAMQLPQKCKLPNATQC